MRWPRQCRGHLAQRDREASQFGRPELSMSQEPLKGQLILEPFEILMWCTCYPTASALFGSILVDILPPPRAFLSSKTGMADEVAVTCPLVYAIVSKFFLSNLISLSSRIVLDFHVHQILSLVFRNGVSYVHLCLVSWVPKRTKGTRGGQRQWHVQGWLRWGRGATSGFPLHCRTTQVAGTSAGHRCTATVLFVLRLLQLSCSECPLKKRGGCKGTDMKHINILNISAIPSTRYQFRKFQSNPFQFFFIIEGTCQEWRTCHLHSKM